MATPLIILFGALIAIPVGIVAVLYLIVPLIKAIGWVIRQIFRFIFGEIGDALRIVGAIITQVVLFPLVILNVLIGRWSAAGHFGRALKSEFKTTFACLYRVAIGHPARFLCLTALTDGLEKRLPEVMAAAPTSDKPNPKTVGQFEGYSIIGSLPGGGSGGKLYVAAPDAMKLAIFARNGRSDIRQVVIKTFSLRDGSSLPQIVRESRALEAAKKLGLVLEHELTNERFFYVTQYMPGESLGLVTQRLHALSGGDGLSNSHLSTALSYGAELLQTLEGYHRGGLWHKDVKPDNIIVEGRSAHLVDFGLVTPLRSGMTLTTHGTEYFRDPEMVRLALKGVKVHQVDGARFDVYAAGAVLFSIIENSFPAHGGLSQITRRCPEALRWIVRRAMADYDKRYASAGAMRADLDVVRLAADPFAVKPVELPSMRGAGAPVVEVPDDAPIRPVFEPAPVGAGSGIPGAAAAVAGMAAAGSPALGADRARPRLRVNNWWSGGYSVDGDVQSPRGQAQRAVDEAMGHAQRAVTTAMAAIGLGGGGGRARPVGFTPVPGSPAWTPRHSGRTAREQVQHARERVKAARERARDRMNGRRRAPGGGGAGDFNTMNLGVGGAVFLFLVICAGLVAAMMTWTRGPRMQQPGRVAVDSFSVSELSYAALDLPDGATASQVRNASDSPSPRVIVNGAVVSPVAPPLPAEPPLATGERALVISDVVPLTAGMTAAVDRLREAGFVVLGNYPGNTATQEEVLEQNDLVAQVRAVRNLAPLTAEDTSQTLSQWVAAQGDLGVVVWFAKSDPEKPAAQAFIFARWHDPADQSADDTVLAAAAAALRGR